MKPPKQEVRGNLGQALVNKNRRQHNASGICTKIIGGDWKGGKPRESAREIYICNQRESRRKMSNLLASLQDLLPRLPSKVDQSTILEETAKYIKSLKQDVEKLEKQKQERLQSVSTTFGCESSLMNLKWQYPYNSKEAFNIADHGSSSSSLVPWQPVAFQTWSSQNVVLNICGNEAQFCVCATRKPGQFTTIAFVLEKHKIEVISANILCNGNANGYIILAHTNIASTHQFPMTTSVEEVYKQAAEEISLLIS